MMQLAPDAYKLARSTDPETSKAAAQSISLRLKDSHRWILNWLTAHGPATDDEMALAAVDAGLVSRTESARRQVRTLREKHELIVSAVDERTGIQRTFVNASGRQALAWVAKDANGHFQPEMFAGYA
tara:strand:+ start:138 stop:518 length:381 start_codon:yes stop_codon:yes gene_type:complete